MSGPTAARLAIYPGSFDPITHGHTDIVRRTLRFCDRVVVAVAHRATHPKEGLFSIEERLELIREVFDGEDRIEAVSFSGLLVDFARERGIHVIVRGLRAVSDFEYEFQMALMNRDLAPAVETVFLAPDARYSFLSASLVREIASLGGDIGAFVAPAVQQRLKQKLNQP
jgi:pantetheine-phosphate adenylyltransferase